MQRMGKMNLTDAERDKLLTATRSRPARVADVRRAKLILMLEEGQSRDTIMTGAATSCRLNLATYPSLPVSASCASKTCERKDWIDTWCPTTRTSRPRRPM